MKIEWEQYLRVAKELADIATKAPYKDAKLRSAISRAYYAAFNEAFFSLPQKTREQIANTESKHSQVITQFESSTDPTRAQIGVNLRRLRIDRNKADYDESIEMSLPKYTNQTTLAVNIAEDVISDLSRLKN